MTSPEDHRPAGPSPEATATATSALIETTLHDARIAVLHPTRIVLVGDGQRLRIDLRGVQRQRLRDLRVAMPAPPDATANSELQRRLAEWAGASVPLHVHELVRSGDGFLRTLHLTDADGRQAVLHQGRGYSWSS